jgi:hypothetical protein
MKILFIISSLVLALASKDGCKKNKTVDNVYKGRLEIKGICMNYTIKILEGNIDTSLVASTWTDETTGKSYNNVFKLGSPCTFPENIQQGDEFTFAIDTAAEKGCAVCMAYYPTPQKHLSIKVTGK